jgi:hypothetical protein
LVLVGASNTVLLDCIYRFENVTDMLMIQSLLLAPLK